MSKSKNNKKVENLTIDCELSEKEMFEVMVRGTATSCKLVKILTNTGSGHIGVCAAFYGLAKAYVLIEKLALLYGYDMQPFYQESKDFWEAYAQTKEFEESLKNHGFKLDNKDIRTY